jgi:hypothetical protein
VTTKDVGEYADAAEAMWHAHGLTAEAIGEGPLFNYIEEPGRSPRSVGRLLCRLTFPGHPKAFLPV